MTTQAVEDARRGETRGHSKNLEGCCLTKAVEDKWDKENDWSGNFTVAGFGGLPLLSCFPAESQLKNTTFCIATRKSVGKV